jgi:hypothetical protein
VRVKQVQKKEESSEMDNSDERTSLETEDADRLFNKRPVYQYSLRKFRSIYNAKQSFDMAKIQWLGCLKCRMCNQGNMTKYAVLVRMVCEAVSGYTCKLRIYAADGYKLDDKEN